MGIIEQLQEENRELRREFDTFKAFISDYIAEIDDEIKGYEAAAKFTGLSKSTLERLKSEGRIPYDKHGRIISFSRKDLIAYKQSRRLAKCQDA